MQGYDFNRSFSSARNAPRPTKQTSQKTIPKQVEVKTPLPINFGGNPDDDENVWSTEPYKLKDRGADGEARLNIEKLVNSLSWMNVKDEKDPNSSYKLQGQKMNREEVKKSFRNFNKFIDEYIDIEEERKLKEENTLLEL